MYCPVLSCSQLLPCEAHKLADKPWNHWPLELPQSREAESKLLTTIEDNDFHRELHREIRTQFLSRVSLPPHSAVLLQGGTSAKFELYDSDTEVCPFRQEAFFRYLFEINEPDCFGMMSNGKFTLFVPAVSDDSQRWNGPRRPLDYYTERYGVDNAYLTGDLEKVLDELGIQSLYVVHGQNCDSDNWSDTSAIDALPSVKSGARKVDRTTLYPILAEMRVIKTPREQEFLRNACLVSSQAHTYAMRHVRPGLAEVQLEAMFRAWTCYYGGSRHTAYTCICATGHNGATLHYGHAGRPNDRILLDGDMALMDMGGEYRGYATDLTRSYPVNGKFTQDQRDVYTAVLEAQKAVLNAMKPGVFWPDMHKLAESVILTHLIKMGVLHGTLEEVTAAHIGAVFMPHGLGHLFGMWVHDVGGYGPEHPLRSSELGVCYLRTSRELKEGMCLTVEPGCYFNQFLLDKARNNEQQRKFLNDEVLARFKNFGGVRLEDDVVVTKDGIENWSIMPTEIEDIEAVIQAH